jgi:hypothetical protein
MPGIVNLYFAFNNQGQCTHFAQTETIFLAEVLFRICNISFFKIIEELGEISPVLQISTGIYSN